MDVQIWISYTETSIRIFQQSPNTTPRCGVEENESKIFHRGALLQQSRKKVLERNAPLEGYGEPRLNKFQAS